MASADAARLALFKAPYTPPPRFGQCAAFHALPPPPTFSAAAPSLSRLTLRFERSGSRHTWRKLPRASRVFITNASAGGGDGKDGARGGSSRDGDSSGSDKSAGDEQMQQLLADLVQLQSDKVRVEEFVEQRSKLLTGIAESASAGYERINETAKRNLEAASNKAMQQLDAEADELERELAASREEIERNEREFDEFEKSVQEKRNAMLFFKQLYKRPSGVEPPTSRDRPSPSSSSSSSSPSSKSTPLQGASSSSFEADSLSASSTPSPPTTPELSYKERVLHSVPGLASANQNAASSKTRRSMYALLVALAGTTFVQALSHQPMELFQVAASGVVFAALLMQALYERSIAGKSTDDSKK